MPFSGVTKAKIHFRSLHYRIKLLNYNYFYRFCNSICLSLYFGRLLAYFQRINSTSSKYEYFVVSSRRDPEYSKQVHQTAFSETVR